MRIRNVEMFYEDLLMPTTKGTVSSLEVRLSKR